MFTTPSTILVIMLVLASVAILSVLYDYHLLKRNEQLKDINQELLRRRVADEAKVSSYRAAMAETVRRYAEMPEDQREHLLTNIHRHSLSRKGVI